MSMPIENSQNTGLFNWLSKRESHWERISASATNKLKVSEWTNEENRHTTTRIVVDFFSRPNNAGDHRRNGRMVNANTADNRKEFKSWTAAPKSHCRVPNCERESFVGPIKKTPAATTDEPSRVGPHEIATNVDAKLLWLTMHEGGFQSKVMQCVTCNSQLGATNQAHHTWNATVVPWAAPFKTKIKRVKINRVNS